MSAPAKADRDIVADEHARIHKLNLAIADNLRELAWLLSISPDQLTEDHRKHGKQLARKCITDVVIAVGIT